MCCSAKGVKSIVFADNIRNSAEVCLDSSKERALEVNSVLGEWVGEWLLLTCRTEIIRVSLGGFRGGCREVTKGEERVCRKGRNKIREKRVDYDRKVVWCGTRGRNKRYREDVKVSRR